MVKPRQAADAPPHLRQICDVINFIQLIHRPCTVTYPVDPGFCRFTQKLDSTGILRSGLFVWLRFFVALSSSTHVVGWWSLFSVIIIARG